jgi:hypothetical protein
MEFKIIISNNGPGTIHNFSLDIKLETDRNMDITINPPQSENISYERMIDGISSFPLIELVRPINGHCEIFPGQKHLIHNGVWQVFIERSDWIHNLPRDGKIEREKLMDRYNTMSCFLKWELFLDNAPPSTGKINLLDFRTPQQDR